MPGLVEMALSFGAVLALTGLPLLLIPVAMAYAALRVRDARHRKPDRWLGLKTAFHLVQSLAVLTALAGLSVSAADLMQGQLGGKPRNQPPAPRPAPPGGGRPAPRPAPADDTFWTTAQRTAAALVSSGALFGLVFWGLLMAQTNDRKYTAVRRTFVGGRLTVCLLVVYAAVTGLALVLAQKDPGMEPVELLTGMLTVWLPAAAIHLFLFHRAARRPTEPDPPPASDRLDHGDLPDPPGRS